MRAIWWFQTYECMYVLLLLLLLIFISVHLVQWEIFHIIWEYVKHVHTCAMSLIYADILYANVYFLLQCVYMQFIMHVMFKISILFFPSHLVVRQSPCVCLFFFSNHKQQKSKLYAKLQLIMHSMKKSSIFKKIYMKLIFQMQFYCVYYNLYKI